MTHPPQEAGVHPCPTDGTAVTFKRYWDSNRGGRYLTQAQGHCPDCYQAGRAGLRLTVTGQVLQRGDRTYPPCQDCGKPKRSQAPRCRDCSMRQLWADGRKDWDRITHCRFRHCGLALPEPLATVHPDTGHVVGGRSYCSVLCSRAEAKARRAEKLKGTRPQKRPKERDHRLSLAYRDHYLCHLCGDLIDLSLPVAHPQSFTLDHVTPLAQGGTNDDDNLRSAHWSCNSRKGG